MRKNKKLVAGRSAERSDANPPIPAISGPLLGLVYIVYLPLVGIATFIRAVTYRVKHRLVALRHRTT